LIKGVLQNEFRNTPQKLLEGFALILRLSGQGAVAKRILMRFATAPVFCKYAGRTIS
jgi:hypothetical protein